MAELSYYDVRRAVQEELRTLQTVIQEIHQSHQDIRRQMQQSYQMWQHVQQMTHKINLIQQQLTTLSNLYYNLRGSQDSNTMGPVAQQMYQMNLRLSEIEEVCRGINAAIGGKPVTEVEAEQENGRTNT